MISPRSYCLDRLRHGLGKTRLHFFARVGSTNSHAARMRREGRLFAPSVVVTSRQTAGRGRGANTWYSDRGSITATFALPIDAGAAPHQLPIIAGLAVRDAAAELCGADIQLKWPNDLMYEDRKLAGLLCERIDKADLIGLGLNVNTGLDDAPADVRRRLVTLAQIAGREIDLTDALLAVSTHLNRLLTHRQETSFAQVLRRYDRHHLLVGRTVSVATRTTPLAGSAAVDTTLTGLCRGLDTLGRLVVDDALTTHRVISGQVLSF